MEQITIPMASIRRGIDQYTFNVPTEALNPDPERIRMESLQATVNVSPAGEDFLLTLSILMQGVFKCDRCSEWFDDRKYGKLTTLFTPDPSKIEAADGGEIRLFNVHATEINITQEIMDGLVLNIPEKLLCRKDCRGICIQCGTNLNESTCSCIKDESDPRWDALKNMKFDE